MSEQVFQRQQDEHENTHFDDPLAELARIVSEEETKSQPANSEIASKATVPQSTENQIPETQTAQHHESTPEGSDIPAPKTAETNPFAKYIVEPVNIAELPKHSTPSRVFGESNLQPVASGVIGQEEMARHEQQIAEPAVQEPILEELHSAMEEISAPEIDSSKIGASTGDGSMDLESQLMAELDSEVEKYEPQHVEEIPLVEELQSDLQHELLPDQQLEKLTNEQIILQQTQAQSEVVAGLEPTFIGGEQPSQELDFEASLEQSLALVSDRNGEMTVGQSGNLENSQNNDGLENQPVLIPQHSVNVQEEIDAVLNALEHPVTIEQVNAPVDESAFDQQNFSTAFDSGSDNLAPKTVELSMGTMSTALADNAEMHTELPDLPEPVEIATDVETVASAEHPPETQVYQPALDYGSRQRQIDDSVLALQDNLVDSLDIESAFSDAFATELSLEMGSEQPALTHSDQQIDDVQLASTHQSEFQNGSIVNKPDLATNNSEFTAESTEMGVFEDQGADNGYSSVDQSELDIDQAIAGVVQEDTRKHTGYRLAAIALGIAVLTGAGVVGYGLIGESNSTGDPILVRANQNEFKIKPDQPGGKEIANQDQPVYVNMTGDKSTESSQKKLVSSNEQPVELDTKIRSLRPEKSAERLTTSNKTSTQNTANAFVQPRKVKTVTVRADGTIMTSAGTQLSNLGAVPSNINALVGSNDLQANQIPVSTLQLQNNNVDQGKTVDGAISTGTIAIPIANPFVVSKPNRVVVKSTVKSAALEDPVLSKPVDVSSNSSSAIVPKPVVTTPVNTLTTTPENKVTKTVQKPVASVATLAAKPSAINTAVSSDVYKVQISSQRSLESAEATYQNLKRKFAGLLSGQSKEIRAVDVDGKGTFFRVQIPVGEMSEAASFCKRYKAAGGSCFVTR